MPQVPIPKLNEPQVRSQGLPNVRVNENAPIESFGGGAAVDKIVETSTGIINEAKQQADTVAHIAADSQASQLATDIQIKASQLKGADSFGAPEMVKDEWQKGTDKIREGLTNDAQRMAFDRSATGYFDSLHKTTQMHMAAEGSRYRDETTQGFLTTSQNAAVMNAFDDKKVGDEINKQKAVMSDWASTQGIKPEDPQYQARLTETLSATHKGVIQSRIEAGNSDSAKAYLDANKDTMSASDIIQAQGRLEHAEVLKQGVDAWNQLKNSNQNYDGTYNESKMQSQIFARDDMSIERKQQVFDFVKGQAAQAMADKTRRDGANEKAFDDTITKYVAKGVPIEDAYKKIPDFYGTDPSKLQAARLKINAYYGPPAESDIATFLQLKDKSYGGTLGPGEIDQAFANKRLSGSDYRSLMVENLDAKTNGTNPDQKQGYERVKIMAEEKYGSDKDAKEKFLYLLHTQTQGMKGEEIIKRASDIMQKDPNTGIFGFMRSEKWKADFEKKDAESLAWGKVYQDVGRDTANAIGKGALATGSKSWGVGDVDAFAQQLGGYNAIKAGTPANNAMQSLMRDKKLVTPANIKAVLSQYPDGKY